MPYEAAIFVAIGIIIGASVVTILRDTGLQDKVKNESEKQDGKNEKTEEVSEEKF